MPRFVHLHRFMPYGAPDLLADAPARLSRAIASGSALATALFALAVLLAPAARDVERRVALPFVTIAPPPSVLEPPARPAYIVPPTVTNPRRGLIVPVEAPLPDAPVAPVESPPGAEAGTGAPSDAGPAASPSNAIVTPPDGAAPDRAVEYFDVFPEPVRRVDPEYPSIAKDAGVEGRVLVRVLVSSTGVVLQAVADPRTTVPMLEPAALEAARKWLFKPALANGHPVAVWIALPFVFRLHE